MTNKPEGPGKGPQRPPETGAPKRPYATIDAKATEVKAEPAAGPGKPSSPPGTGSAAAGAATPEAAGRPEAAAAAKVAAAAVGGAKTALNATPGAGASGGGAKGGEGTSGPRAGTPPTGTAPLPSQPARRGGGLGRLITHTAAGIIGGLAALFGAQNLPQLQSWLGLSAPAAVSPELSRRLDALEQLARARPTPAMPDELARRLAELEGQLGRVSEAARAVGGLGEAQLRLTEDLKAVRDALAQQGRGADAERLARLEERLSAISAAATAEPGRAGPIPQLAQITGRIADLETALTNRLATARRDMVREIETRLATTAETSETARSGTQRLDREVATLKSEATRLGQRTEALRTDADRLQEAARVAEEQRQQLRAGIDGLKSELVARLKEVARPADVAAALKPLADRVAKLETGIAGVVDAEQDRRANAERIILSLELANLKRALDRGGRFAAELAEVKRIGGARLDLAALERFQQSGVASVADLQRSFRNLANAIIEAAAEQPDAGVVDRLLSGARTIVRVRKTSPDAADTSVEAMVARMEQALKDGRLADVLAHAKAIPDKGLAPAREWLAQVEARHTVETAIAGVERQLKSNLGPGSSADPSKGPAR